MNAALHRCSFRNVVHESRARWKPSEWRCIRHASVPIWREYSVSMAQEKVLVPMKKIPRKIQVFQERSRPKVTFVTLAYATANAYDLNGIRDALVHQRLCESSRLAPLDVPDVVHASVGYKSQDEPRDIFFFKEGVTVFWNCSELEASNTLQFLTRYECERYSERIVKREREVMTYFYHTGKKCQMQDSHFILTAGKENLLEKYTFSNAMAQSVKLEALEAALERLAQTVRAVSGEMKQGNTPTLDRQHVARKLGELLSLRHCINVESDLLDTPDFYWEREELEKLYAITIAYFSISRRTRVLNSRLTHCVELARLVCTWAADRHSVRLEWLVIALLVACVSVESLRFVEAHLPGPSAVADITGGEVSLKTVCQDLQQGV